MLQATQIIYFLIIIAHSHQVTNTHLGTMSNTVIVIDRARVAINKKLFWGDAFNAHLAAFHCSRNLEVMDRIVNLHPRLVDFDRSTGGVLDNLDVGLVNKQGELHVVEVLEVINLLFLIHVPINFNNSRLLNQGVMKSIVKHSISV